MRVRLGLVIVAVIVTACATAQTPTSSAGDLPPTPSRAASPSASVAAGPTGAAGSPSPRRALIADVDLGGRSNHIECRGTDRPGGPTILLENGLDTPAVSWGRVRASLEELATVCSYDRAGVQGSKPAPERNRTVEDLADDLEATLAGAEIAGPFLIVAHSLGPWVSTVYTSRHPADVVGLVFVDPRGPGMTERQRAVVGEPSSDEPESVTGYRDWLDTVDDNLEHIALAPSEAITAAMLDADGPFYGDRPVAVLGAGRTIDQGPRLPDDMLAELRSVWPDLQRRFADESTRGSFVDVPSSGHFVMDDAPAAVIDAVTSMLEEIDRQ